MDLTTSVMFLHFFPSVWLKDLIWLQLDSRLQHSEADRAPGCEWHKPEYSQVRFKNRLIGVWRPNLSEKRLKLLTHNKRLQDALYSQSLWKGTDAAPDPDLGTVMGQTGHHVRTELPVYPCLGDRGDLLEKVIRKWRGLWTGWSWKDYYYPGILDTDYACHRMSCQTQVANRDWTPVMNGLMIRNKH